MKKNPVNKLSLAKSTVRSLSAPALAQVGGGAATALCPTQPPTAFCTQAFC